MNYKSYPYAPAERKTITPTDTDRNGNRFADPEPINAYLTNEEDTPDGQYSNRPVEGRPIIGTWRELRVTDFVAQGGLRKHIKARKSRTKKSKKKK